MGEIVELKRAEMPDEELRAEWDRLGRQKKDVLKGELLLRAYKSGKTQEQIADVIGKTRQYVACLLTYYDWIQNATMVANPEFQPDSITERQFRPYFAMTEGSRDERYRATTALIIQAKKCGKRYKEIAAAIKSHKLANGRDRNVKNIARTIDYPIDEVKLALSSMATCKHGTYGLIAKKKGAVTYAIAEGGGAVIDRLDFYQRIRPWLDELKEMGNVSHAVQLSPQDISALAYRIERELLGTINRPVAVPDEAPLEEEE